MIPKQFTAIYQCEHCGEEIDLENCFVPAFNMPCDECGVLTRFIGQKIIHKVWEWDTIEDGPDV